MQARILGRVIDRSCLPAVSGRVTPNRLTGSPSTPFPALIRCGMESRLVVPDAALPHQSATVTGALDVLPSA